MLNRMTHPAVLATATAGLVLAITAAMTTVPWWLWLGWAALGAVAVAQAARSRT